MKLPTDSSVLVLILLAAAMGLAFLPIVVAVANPDTASIAALSGAYVSLILGLAPLISKGRRNGNGNGRRRDGDRSD